MDTGRGLCGIPGGTLQGLGLRADVAGVEGAGDRDVRGALDDGATIFEEREGKGCPFEAEEEIIEADRAMRGEPCAHEGEVDGAVVLVDLDGVSAA